MKHRRWESHLPLPSMQFVGGVTIPRRGVCEGRLRDERESTSHLMDSPGFFSGAPSLTVTRQGHLRSLVAADVRLHQPGWQARKGTGVAPRSFPCPVLSAVPHATLAEILGASSGVPNVTSMKGMPDQTRPKPDVQRDARYRKQRYSLPRFDARRRRRTDQHGRLKPQAVGPAAPESISGFGACGGGYSGSGIRHRRSGEWNNSAESMPRSHLSIAVITRPARRGRCSGFAGAPTNRIVWKASSSL